MILKIEENRHYLLDAPLRLCAVRLVFTLGGSSLGVLLRALPLPRLAVDFKRDIGGEKTGLGEDGGETGSSFIGARSIARSSGSSMSAHGSDINLHKS